MIFDDFFVLPFYVVFVLNGKAAFNKFIAHSGVAVKNVLVYKVGSEYHVVAGPPSVKACFASTKKTMDIISENNVLGFSKSTTGFLKPFVYNDGVLHLYNQNALDSDLCNLLFSYYLMENGFLLEKSGKFQYDSVFRENARNTKDIENYQLPKKISEHKSALIVAGTTEINLASAPSGQIDAYSVVLDSAKTKFVKLYDQTELLGKATLKLLLCMENGEYIGRAYSGSTDLKRSTVLNFARNAKLMEAAQITLSEDKVYVSGFPILNTFLPCVTGQGTLDLVKRTLDEAKYFKGPVMVNKTSDGILTATGFCDNNQKVEQTLNILPMRVETESEVEDFATKHSDAVDFTRKNAGDYAELFKLLAKQKKPYEIVEDTRSAALLRLNARKTYLNDRAIEFMESNKRVDAALTDESILRFRKAPLLILDKRPMDRTLVEMINFCNNGSGSSSNAVISNLGPPVD